MQNDKTKKLKEMQDLLKEVSTQYESIVSQKEENVE